MMPPFPLLAGEPSSLLIDLCGLVVFLALFITAGAFLLWWETERRGLTVREWIDTPPPGYFEINSRGWMTSIDAEPEVKPNTEIWLRRNEQ